MAQTASRQERVRAGTLAEIRATARRLLLQGGHPAVTISAVAREMGMTGPAVYRYYASHEALVDALTADCYDELVQVLLLARDAAQATPAARLLALSRALRAWAVAHPAEFGLMFASPIPGAQGRPAGSPAHLASQRFGLVFLDQVAEIWHVQGFHTRRLADLPASLAVQLRDYSVRIGKRLPPKAARVFLSCWIRLYGLVSMEVTRQLDFAYSDLEPVFEECLQDLCAMLGLPYEPPETAAKIGRAAR